MSASGYTRQSASQIASGQQVASAPVNNEFNQLQSAFSGTSGHDHSGGTGLGPVLTSAAIGINTTTAGVVCTTGTSGVFTSRTITGTSGTITVTNGTGASGNPTLTIDAAYVGQSSITTLGTIGTGTWHGSIIAGTYGGTGINNGANTLTLGGNFTSSSTVSITGALTTAAAFTTSGANALTLTTTALTNITLPTSGTLVNSAVTTLSSLTSIGTIGTGVWQGTVVGSTYGGTGVNNGSNTITLGGNLTTAGAFNTTLTVTAGTNVTLPTSGTLATTAQIVSTPISLTNGGTAASLTASNGGIVYSTASTLAILSSTATANQVLLSGSSTTPAWSTTTYPATTTAKQILYSSATNTIAGLATGNSSLLVTDGSGTPSLSTTIPNGVVATTQSAADSSTKLATTAFVNSTALTLANGTTATTQSAADSTTKVATTAFVNSTALTLANGTTATTQISTDSSTKVATTAFVNSVSIISNQNSVIGSRSAGTAYQNTTGKTMFVTVTSTGNTGNTFEAFTDSSNPPTTSVAKGSIAANSAIASITFIVLNNNYYKITTVGANLTIWTEWY